MWVWYKGTFTPPPPARGAIEFMKVNSGTLPARPTVGPAYPGWCYTITCRGIYPQRRGGLLVGDMDPPETLWRTVRYAGGTPPQIVKRCDSGGSAKCHKLEEGCGNHPGGVP